VVDNRCFLFDILPKNSVGAEIGVHLGDFSQRILDNLNPAKLYLVDPWRFEESEQYENAWYGLVAGCDQNEMNRRHLSVCDRFSENIASAQVNVFRCDSMSFLNQMPDNFFDWVYIDGNHLYEFVRQDIILSTKKVKANGLICGDDYGEGGWWNGGVKKAVDELVDMSIVVKVDIKESQFILRPN
jgi:hypothetical protein